MDGISRSNSTDTAMDMNCSDDEIVIGPDTATTIFRCSLTISQSGSVPNGLARACAKANAHRPSTPDSGHALDVSPVSNDLEMQALPQSLQSQNRAQTTVTPCLFDISILDPEFVQNFLAKLSLGSPEEEGSSPYDKPESELPSRDIEIKPGLFMVGDGEEAGFFQTSSQGSPMDWEA